MFEQFSPAFPDHCLLTDINVETGVDHRNLKELICGYLTRAMTCPVLNHASTRTRLDAPHSNLGLALGSKVKTSDLNVRDNSRLSTTDLLWYDHFWTETTRGLSNELMATFNMPDVDFTPFVKTQALSTSYTIVHWWLIVKTITEQCATCLVLKKNNISSVYINRGSGLNLNTLRGCVWKLLTLWFCQMAVLRRGEYHLSTTLLQAYSSALYKAKNCCIYGGIPVLFFLNPGPIFTCLGM